MIHGEREMDRRISVMTRGATIDWLHADSVEFEADRLFVLRSSAQCKTEDRAGKMDWSVLRRR